MASRALVLVLFVASAPAHADPSCVDDAQPLSADALRARLGQLAAPELDGRAPGSDGDRAARAAIVERFRCLGLAPGGRPGYEQAFTDGATPRTSSATSPAAIRTSAATSS